ncbi:MAG: STAS domain-containing protein [Acidimicrobiales bacterium]
MAANGSSQVPAGYQVGMSYVDIEADVTVVWLTGEHDVSTVAELCERMASAERLDGADVVVDLSAVEFLGAATLAIIVGTRTRLGRQSRSLTLRSPSRCARRVLDVCGLTYVTTTREVGVTHARGSAAALGTWVAVPAEERANQPAIAPAPSPGIPDRVGARDHPAPEGGRTREADTAVGGPVGPHDPGGGR